MSYDMLADEKHSMLSIGLGLFMSISYVAHIMYYFQNEPNHIEVFCRQARPVRH
jgi:hypothetical protein